MRKPKPDDYFSNGAFEFARFGRHIVSRNNMSPKQHQSYISKFKDNYQEIKNVINKKISEIKNDVLNCDPIRLLQFSSDVFKMERLKPMGLEETEELSETMPDNMPYLATEYIQSIYASSPKSSIISNDEDKSILFYNIIDDIEELIVLMFSFYMCWGTTINESYPDLDEDVCLLLFEEQLLFSVRGNRYQIFEREYFEKLLLPHNAIFVELFGITAKEIIEGIAKIQYALSKQKVDIFNQSLDLFDKVEPEYVDEEQFFTNNEKELTEIANQLFGTKLCDVKGITEWPKMLIDELSWKQGDCTEFWEGEYGGWPIKDMPISKRPFVIIDDRAYCFDYYSFVDNIYRSIQKATTRIKPDYQWSKVQQVASERMVAEIFESILPGCQTFESNYYPINNSLKQMAENDLLVLYDDTLIIVEVKAGSFVYTAPITDFNAHIKSFKKLIEEADVQCQRTKEYLERNVKSKIYNHDKSEKVEINLSNYKSIYMMSVTIDNINEFAAKAEKLSFLKLQSKAISISIDDLMVYREYFSSPLVFLHYLKQRKLATQNPLLALNDELDHLGMYIEHNCYNLETQGLKKGTKIQFIGYREKLNAYFDSLYHPGLILSKPVQKLPALFEQIIEYLVNHNVDGRCSIANYLLDFSFDAKEEFCQKTYYVLNRQKEVCRTIPFSASGNNNSLRFTVFVNQAPYEANYSYQLDYALATLSWNKEKDRKLITLKFTNDKFEKIEFRDLTPSDIYDENRERIIKLGEQNAKLRFKEYKRKHPGKIGRNELCPCGSGKKYKKCCGR